MFYIRYVTTALTIIMIRRTNTLNSKKTAMILIQRRVKTRTKMPKSQMIQMTSMIMIITKSTASTAGVTRLLPICRYKFIIIFIFDCFIIKLC